MRLPWNSSVKRRSKSTRRGPSSDSPAGCSMEPPPKMPQAAGNKTKFRRFAPAQWQSSGKSGMSTRGLYLRLHLHLRQPQADDTTSMSGCFARCGRHDAYILAALTPSAIEVSLQLAGDLELERAERQRRWAERLERARYAT